MNKSDTKLNCNTTLMLLVSNHTSTPTDKNKATLQS